MKVAIISPIALLGSLSTDYHLVLPHLLSRPKYRAFYQSLTDRDFVILDNGAAEGLLVGLRALHALAKDLKPNEIVLPDRLSDNQETKVLVAEAMREFVYSDQAYMAVAQGETVEQALDCIAFYESFPSITTVGLPRVLNKDEKRTREYLTAYLIQHGWFGRFNFHYLGVTPYYYDEVKILESMTNSIAAFRGIDTSAPVSLGLQNISIKDNYMYAKRPNDYFHATRSNPTVRENVDTFLEWAGA